MLGRQLPQRIEQRGLLQAIAVSPDGKTLAISIEAETSSDEKNRKDNLVLVDIQTGKVIRREPTPESYTDFLVFSPDGRWLVSNRRLWEVATLKEISQFPWVTAAGFSPDSKRLATGYENGTAQVWPIKGE